MSNITGIAKLFVVFHIKSRSLIVYSIFRKTFWKIWKI